MKNLKFDDEQKNLSITKIRKIILEWRLSNYKDFPWRKTENKWHALLAEILLQRTKAATVVPVYKSLIAKFLDPTDVISASLSELEQLIYSLGLPARAKVIKELAASIDKRQGKIPENIEEMTKLPGVGSYIAAAWLSFHAGKKAVIVDANVVRWICRLVDRQCDAETRRKKWLIELAEKLTPDRNVKEYNYAVLDFTMEICAKKPLCEVCPLGAKLCAYGKKKLLSIRLSE